VVDGDTIIVDYYGKAERVRLLTKYGTSKNYDAAFRAAEKFASENKKWIWAVSGLSSRAPP